MAATTTLLGLVTPTQGTLSGTWGDTVNYGISDYVDISVAGTLTLTNDGAVTLANTTGSSAGSNITSSLTGAGTVTAQFAIVKVTGTLTVAKVVTGPSYSKTYTVVNSATGGIVTFKASGQTGVSIAVGETAFVYFNGTDYVKIVGTATAGAAGGSTTQVQYNNAGVLAGITGATTNGTALTLVAPNLGSPASVGTMPAFTLGGTVSGGGNQINNVIIGTSTPLAGTFTQLDITAQGTLRLQDTTGGEYVALRSPSALGASYTLTFPADDGTSGQALITDGSGVLSWSTAASGDVYGPGSSTDNAVARFDSTTGKLLQNSVVLIGDTGAVTGVTDLTASGSVTLSGGTANGVAYLNGSKVVTSGSALTFDGTNFVVGGTAVFGKSTIINSLSGTAAAIGISDNATTTMYANNVSSGVSALWSSGALAFGSNNGTFTERMRLDSTGLGIGTTSPSVKLHASTSGAGIQEVEWLNNSQAVGADVGSAMVFTGTSSNNGLARISGAFSGATTADGAYMAFSTRAVTTGALTERLRLDSAGNLGLGVTPSAWSGYKAIEISGGAAFSSGANAAFMNSNSYNNGTNWIYRATTFAGQYDQFNGQHRWFNAPSGTAGNAITFTQAMTLDASGNLGIGTTSPAGRLDVVGTADQIRGGNGTVTSFLGGSGSNGYTGTLTNHPFLFYTNSSLRATLDTAGNLGLGVTPSAWSGYGAPIIQLPNTGTIVSNDQFAYFGANWYYATSAIRYITSSQAASYYGQTGGAHKWFSAPSGTAGDAITFTQAMTLDASGNLGIGTTSPVGRLGVVKTGDNSRISIGDTASSTYSTLLMYGGAGKYNFQLGVQNNVNNAFEITPSTATGGTTFSTPAFVLDSSGNVGIGTSSPSDILTLAGGASGSYGLTINNAKVGGGTKAIFQYDATNAIALVGGNTTNGLAFQTLTGGSLTTKATIDSSGNLGLGVTPSAWDTAVFRTLQVGTGVGSASLSGRTDGIPNATLGINVYYGTGAYRYIGNGTANYYNQQSGVHSWHTAASGTAGDAITFTQAMTLDASGNLSIGTTSPTAKLHVSANSSGAYVGTVIENTNTGGYTSLNFSIGSVGSGGTAGVNYAPGIFFAIGPTSNDTTTPIVFRNNNATERARIDTSGNLLVGTTSAGGKLTVEQGSANANGAIITNQTYNYQTLGLHNTATANDNIWVTFGTEASFTTRGSITYNRAGGLTAYNVTSDYRAKDISGSVTNSGALIDSIPVYMGKMKDATQERPMFIAHETPAYAHTGVKDAVDADGNPVYQQMDASALIPVMWAEIQSLRKRLADAGI